MRGARRVLLTICLHRGRLEPLGNAKDALHLHLRAAPTIGGTQHSHVTTLLFSLSVCVCVCVCVFCFLSPMTTALGRELDWSLMVSQAGRVD